MGFPQGIAAFIALQLGGDVFTWWRRALIAPVHTTSLGSRKASARRLKKRYLLPSRLSLPIKRSAGLESLPTVSERGRQSPKRTLSAACSSRPLIVTLCGAKTMKTVRVSLPSPLASKSWNPWKTLRLARDIESFGHDGGWARWAGWSQWSDQGERLRRLLGPVGQPAQIPGGQVPHGSGLSAGHGGQTAEGRRAGKRRPTST